ncbi:MAG: 4Fe-4S dicluster domain-containing protein [Methanosarcinaceae archaeon]|nr:4Fe-4S dicluster domain-containing protein [Methanosarcinaceae archaeon]
MLKIKRSLCTECQICMAICSWFHVGESTTKRSRIIVEGEWPAIPDIRVCLACKDHECVAVCPQDALEWKGWIRLDDEKCDACGACVEACPVNGIHMDPFSGFPLICDTCKGEFQCVQWCPTQAIERKPTS